jgi:hypothetical protein
VLAVRAVDLYDTHAEPIRTRSAVTRRRSARSRLEMLLPAVTSLIANHFRLVAEEAERRPEP